MTYYPVLSGTRQLRAILEIDRPDQGHPTILAFAAFLFGQRF